MFGRSAHPSSSSNAAPEVELREDIEDLYADNLVSAQRVAKLLDKAHKAEVKGIKKQIRKTIGKNQARDLTRSKLRFTKWPEYYWLDCRVNDRTKKEYTTKICMSLPGEILELLWSLGIPQALLSEANLDTPGKKHMQWMREQLQVSELLGFGFHGDGIPCNYDRTESVVMITINLPGLEGKNGRMRIPLVVLPDWAVSENTFDDIMEVIAWSMRHLLAGTRPTERHDGTPFNKDDKNRSKKTDKPKFRACLVQCRGDWDWMGKCFHFPFHNVLEGVCWLCNVKRKEVLRDSQQLGFRV